MLIDDVYRYLELRRSLGFKLHRIDHYLVAFVRFAQEAGDTYIRTATAIAWAKTFSKTQNGRYWRMSEIANFARFLRAEDPTHEVPPRHLFYRPCSRPTPYIYSPDELRRIIEAAGNLSPLRSSPIRGGMYEVLFGLLASTGMRVSEALNLKLGDLSPDGVLHVRNTKSGKSRLVPLHPSVVEVLNAYLRVRHKIAESDDHVFLSADLKRRLSLGSVWRTFQLCLRKANINLGCAHRPRVHDLRHTFATRVLEQCASSHEEVARQFVALSTYLGHSNIRCTYWYLEATPNLMSDIAAAAELLVARRHA
jgi:integrase/recombinase XerD